MREAAESPAASPGALCGPDRKQCRKPRFRAAGGTGLGLGPTGTVWGGWWWWDPIRGSGGQAGGREPGGVGLAGGTEGSQPLRGTPR